jgi:hypothetical protein
MCAFVARELELGTRHHRREAHLRLRRRDQQHRQERGSKQGK